MIITDTTTEEQILGPIVTAKQRLAESAANSVDRNFQVGQHLLGLAQNVYSTEEVAHHQMQYRNMVTSGVSPEYRARFLMEVLGRGADDGWSGRRNDANRSAHDAVRSWVSEQFDHDFPVH